MVKFSAGNIPDLQLTRTQKVLIMQVLLDVLEIGHKHCNLCLQASCSHAWRAPLFQTILHSAVVLLIFLFPHRFILNSTNRGFPFQLQKLFIKPGSKPESGLDKLQREVCSLLRDLNPNMHFMLHSPHNVRLELPSCLTNFTICVLMTTL